MTSQIRISSPIQEGTLQVSKWLDCQLLLEPEEMQALIEELGNFFICNTAGVSRCGEELISKSRFLSEYQNYIDCLKSGKLPNEKELRNCFSSIFTVDLDTLYLVQLNNNRQLIRPCKPVIQLQHHKIGFSTDDYRFRPMVMGSKSIFWGIQISYPQIFQDPKTKTISKVADDTTLLNTPFFKKLQRWVRHNSRATPFIVNGNKSSVPMRLGKKCFSWINSHPQLIEKNIQVEES